MASFLGLPIRVKLHDDRVVEGKLDAIDQALGTLSLDDVQLTLPNGRKTHLSAHLIQRAQIVSLELLSISQEADPSNIPTPTQASYSQPVHSPSHARPQSPVQTKSRPKSRQNAVQEILTNGVSSTYNASDLDQGIATSRHLLPPQPRKRKNRTKSRSGSTSTHTQTRIQSIEAEVSAGAHSFDEDFDFAGGLKSFDKKKVFKEIADADDTDPSLLLVTHNKRDSRYTTKLGIHENVLDESEADLPPPITILRKTSSRSLVPPREMSADPDATDNDTVGEAVRKVFTTQHNLAVPLVSTSQWKEILQIANIETGPNLLQRIENGGRSIASYLVRPNFMPKNQRLKNVVILCGLSTKAQYGLRAGAHLVNKGIAVTAFLVPSEALPANIELHLRLYSAAGGKIVRSINDLADQAAPDIIIDCLLDNEIDTKSKRKNTVLEGEAAFYANANPAPVLCLDMPSGIDPDTGHVSSSWSIQSQYILGLNCLRTGLGMLPGSPKIGLADLALPHAAFERVLPNWPRHLFQQDWIAHIKVA